MGNTLMTDTLVGQILEVRASGAVNMFDAFGVQREANERGLYELVIFIEEHRDTYSRFILTGERG